MFPKTPVQSQRVELSMPWARQLLAREARRRGCRPNFKTESRQNMPPIVDKYRDCTTGLRAPDQTERVLALVQAIEGLPNVLELSSILTFGIQS